MFAGGARPRRAAEGRHVPAPRARTARPTRAPTGSSREAIWRWVTPRWQRHLERILERERDVDAVVVFTVPMSHFRGIPTALRERFSRAGRLLRRRRADEPARVRRHGHGLQLLPRRRSGRVRPRRLELGGRARAAARARRAAGRGGLLGRRSGALPRRWRSTSRWTSSSTATATSSAASGWRRWSASRAGGCREVDFALGGRDFRGDIGAAREIGDVPFNVFGRAISEARINLNITRRAHASVFASSTARPFELGDGGRGDRLESVRGHRALVRAGTRAARRLERGRGGRRLSRAARRSRRGRGARARAPASGRSTSTPTSTGRGGCSSWSACGRRRRSVARG